MSRWRRQRDLLAVRGAVLNHDSQASCRHSARQSRPRPLMRLTGLPPRKVTRGNVQRDAKRRLDPPYCPHSYGGCSSLGGIGTSTLTTLAADKRGCGSGCGAAAPLYGRNAAAPQPHLMGALAAEAHVIPTRILRVRFKPLMMAALVAATGACATTRTTSMAAPEVRGKVFMRVLVSADLQDLEMMQYAERAVGSVRSPSSVVAPDTLVCDPVCRRADIPAQGSNDSTVFIPAHTLLFPGRSYSAEELRKILSENGIDATLVLSPTAAGVSETYVPPTYVTSCSTWNSSTSCSSRAVGGGTLKSPWASFSARLYDAASGQVVWIATSNTNGSPMSGTASLISSMAAETVRKLRSDRVVR